MIDRLILWTTRWGNLASVVGLVLTLVGFAVTILGVYRSKNAAQSARDAAVQTKSLLLRSDAIADVSAALGMMEEIRRLHRAGVWQLLPDRYSALRQKLISVRTSNTDITEAKLIVLRRVSEEFKVIERRVERAIANGDAPPNPAKLNEIVGSHIDAVSEVLVSLKDLVGR